jgi:hypothetical protein
MENKVVIVSSFKVLHRPDTIYHVWHYCKCHGNVFSHSQATFEMLNTNPSYAKCRDNLKDVSSKKDTIVLEISEEVKGGDR